MILASPFIFEIVFEAILKKLLVSSLFSVLTKQPLILQVLCTKSENARLVVQIDNAKLAADDFRTK